MKRREAIAGLLGAATAVSVGSVEAQALSDETLRQMLRFFGGVEARPAEVAHLRAFLLSFRGAAPSEPEVEPAVTFDPRFPE